MSAHTPGPWEVGTRLDKLDFPIVNPKNAEQYNWLIAFAVPGYPESAANARLIAAAPDLLAALKDTVELARKAITQHGTDAEYADVRLEKALTAIARAEGKQ